MKLFLASLLLIVSALYAVQGDDFAFRPQARFDAGLWNKRAMSRGRYDQIARRHFGFNALDSLDKFRREYEEVEEESVVPEQDKEVTGSLTDDVPDDVFGGLFDLPEEEEEEEDDWMDSESDFGLFDLFDLPEEEDEADESEEEGEVDAKLKVAELLEDVEDMLEDAASGSAVDWEALEDFLDDLEDDLEDMPGKDKEEWEEAVDELEAEDDDEEEWDEDKGGLEGFVLDLEESGSGGDYDGLADFLDMLDYDADELEDEVVDEEDEDYGSGSGSGLDYADWAELWALWDYEDSDLFSSGSGSGNGDDDEGFGDFLDLLDEEEDDTNDWIMDNFLGDLDESLESSDSDKNDM